jgi:hypothetical protein
MRDSKMIIETIHRPTIDQCRGGVPSSAALRAGERWTGSQRESVDPEDAA